MIFNPILNLTINFVRPSVSVKLHESEANEDLAEMGLVHIEYFLKLFFIPFI